MGMTMTGGYTGKILRVNLNKKTTGTIPTEKYEEYGGGHGMGSAIFFDLVGEQLPFEAFDPLFSSLEGMVWKLSVDLSEPAAVSAHIIDEDGKVVRALLKGVEKPDAKKRWSGMKRLASLGARLAK